MHSLYWRIFLAFWAALALILIGTLTVALNATVHRTDKPWIERGRLYTQAAQAFEAGGPGALKEWLHSLQTDAQGRTFIVAPDGKELLGRALPPSIYGAPGSVASQAGAAGAATHAGAIAPIGGALVLMTPQGDAFHVVIGPVRDTPRLFGELELPGVPLAPDDGAVKVTEAPLTALFLLSSTVAVNGLGNGVPTLALCPEPDGSPI